MLRDATVIDSTPVLPGAVVDIVDTALHTVVLARVTPKSVAWQPKGAAAAIGYPASGTVALSLTAAQWAALDKAQGLSLRPSEQAVAAKDQP